MRYDDYGAYGDGFEPKETDFMIYEEQKKEIETIRERTITVRLSDADCERLTRKCGEHGLTVGKLVENFIGDLVDGTYTNGSDERMKIDQWFNRCHFGMFPESTLLRHLLCWGYDPEDYLDTLDGIETAKKDKAYLEAHPEEADEEELKWLDEDISDREDELKCMKSEWKPDSDPDMEKEIEIIRMWVEDKENFTNSSMDDASVDEELI